MSNANFASGLADILGVWLQGPAGFRHSGLAPKYNCLWCDLWIGSGFWGFTWVTPKVTCEGDGAFGVSLQVLVQSGCAEFGSSVCLCVCVCGCVRGKKTHTEPRRTDQTCPKTNNQSGHVELSSIFAVPNARQCGCSASDARCDASTDCNWRAESCGSCYANGSYGILALARRSCWQTWT